MRPLPLLMLMLLMPARRRRSVGSRVCAGGRAARTGFFRTVCAGELELAAGRGLAELGSPGVGMYEGLRSTAARRDDHLARNACWRLRASGGATQMCRHVPPCAR